jgi:hypothetical protein
VIGQFQAKTLPEFDCTITRSHNGSIPMAKDSTARPSPNRLRRGEDGYVLLSLLLLVSLMTIATLAVIIPIKFEIQREQEQEMIHRGVQYSRAIRGYYKKWGRYPARLEDLENTNNLRYLRKRYKDPITGKDFRLLHYGEPGLTLAGAIGGGGIPGAIPAGSAGLGGSAQPGSAFGGPGSNGSAFGNSGSSGSAFGNSGFGNSGVNSSGVFSQSSGLGGNSNSGFGASSNNATGGNPPGANQTTGTDPSNSSDSSSTKVASAGASDQSSAGQLVASGPIVGVASNSKNTTIREFNKKKKYNEWQFIYDPGTDRGGLIKTPNQPSLSGFGQPGQNMQSSGTNNSAFGNSNGNSFGNSNGSSFAQPSGFGNNPNPGGPMLPTPPPNPPQQQ